jgi:hypothetical protein
VQVVGAVHRTSLLLKDKSVVGAVHRTSLLLKDKSDTNSPPDSYAELLCSEISRLLAPCEVERQRGRGRGERGEWEAER